MNGRCPQCHSLHSVPGRRGDKISNYRCPDCDTPLEGATTGRAGGRYLCPLANGVVTLGQTGIRLNRPFRAEWQPGYIGRHHIDQPSERDRAALERIAGRLLGKGCVVTSGYDPDRVYQPGWNSGPGIRLVEALDSGHPEAWLVNERLIYRACAACGSRTPDLPGRRPQGPWVPRQREVRKRKEGIFKRVPVDLGPHPTSLACYKCDPRVAHRAS
jgi:hypothetical protein